MNNDVEKLKLKNNVNDSANGLKKRYPINYDFLILHPKSCNWIIQKYVVMYL